MKLYQLLLVCFFTIAAAEDARYEELGKYQIYGPGEIPAQDAAIAVAAENLLEFQYEKKQGGKINLAKASKAQAGDIIKLYESAIKLSTAKPITLVCGDGGFSVGKSVPKDAKGELPYNLEKKKSLIEIQFPKSSSKYNGAWFNLAQALIIPYKYKISLGNPFAETGTEVWSTPSGALYPSILFSSPFWLALMPSYLSNDLQEISCDSEIGNSIDQFRPGGSYILRHLLIIMGAEMVPKSEPRFKNKKVTYFKDWSGATELAAKKNGLARQSAENLRLFAMVAAFSTAGDFSDGKNKGRAGTTLVQAVTIFGLAAIILGLGVSTLVGECTTIVRATTRVRGFAWELAVTIQSPKLWQDLLERFTEELFLRMMTFLSTDEHLILWVTWRCEGAA